MCIFLLINCSNLENCDSPKDDCKSVILKFKPKPSCQSDLSFDLLKVLIEIR